MFKIKKGNLTNDKNAFEKSIGIILIIFFVLNVVALIVTSGYKYDIGISRTLRKGMQYSFVRFGGSFTIIDGYNEIVSYCIPAGMIIFESVYVYLKKYNNKVFKIFNKLGLVLVYAVFLGLFEYYMVTLIPHYMSWGHDQGFGKNFIFGFMIDQTYYWPIYILSIVINNLVCLSLSAFVHFRVAKYPDFLTSKYWEKSVKGFLYVALLYIPYMVMSVGFARPHPYRVDWHEFLYNMKTYDNGKFLANYNTYMHQGFYNGGGTKPDLPYDLSFPGEWPGYKIGAKGSFGHNLSYSNAFSMDYDFPSGHVAEICIALNMIMIIFSKKDASKKFNIVKTVLFAIEIIGGIDMIFAMLVMQGHGESDMAFMFVGALPAYFISEYIVDGAIKILNKTYVSICSQRRNKTNYPRK